MAKKVTYIISNIDRWVAFEWIVERLAGNLVNLNFVLINSKESHFEKYLAQKKIQYFQFDYSSKWQLIGAIFKTAIKLKQWKTEIVHTHFLEANIIGLAAARLVGVKNRIYTRHHSTYHFHYARSGIYWDKICNRFATKIISISDVVSNMLILKENVNPGKIELIHHGFDLHKFKERNENDIQKLRSKYNLNSKFPVVGVVARHIEWKGVQYILEAFRILLKELPDAVLILANARGPFHHDLVGIAKSIPKKNIKWIPFERDVFSLFHLFDVFVHAPVDREIEAFGQIYVEALAAGIPSVFTLSGIANDFIRDEVNAMVVPYKNSVEIAKAVIRIVQNPELARKLKTKGRSDVEAIFTLDRMISKLSCLYRNL